MPSSLSRPVVSTVLSRLFAEAKEVDAEALAPFRRLSPDELRSANADYRSFYAKMRHAYLPISAEFGTLLYMLARARRAITIVEFGTSFGISTIHLAAALADNGGGRLVTTELEPTKIARARQNVAAAGLLDVVEFREGDALDTLKDGVGAPIDLLLLDGAKPLYLPILQRLEPHLPPGAVVAADNAKSSPEFVAFVRDPSHGYVSLALPWDGDDMELAVRTG